MRTDFIIVLWAVSLVIVIVDYVVFVHDRKVRRPRLWGIVRLVVFAPAVAVMVILARVCDVLDWLSVKLERIIKRYED